MGVARIPHDVLISIFECLASSRWAPAGEEAFQNLAEVPIPFPWIDQETIHSISHVCGRWREAALMTTSCWSTIVLDLDGDQSKLDAQRFRIDTYLERIRNRPLTVILRNENVGLSINGFPSGYTDFISACVQEATILYARFIRPDIQSLIGHSLANVPTLQRLTMWRVSNYDCIRIGLNIQIEDEGDLSLLTCLRYAPNLRTIHTCGIPRPYPSIWQCSFPAIESLIIDEAPSSGFLEQCDPFLTTFQNVARLVLAFSGIFKDISNNVITFHHLVYLEMNGDAVYSFFYNSRWIHAPALSTFCIGLAEVEDEDYGGILAGISTELESSSATTKTLVVHGFAKSISGASHVRCLQVIATFPFVDILEFRRCALRFPTTWNRFWRTGCVDCLSLLTHEMNYIDDNDSDNDDSSCEHETRKTSANHTNQREDNRSDDMANYTSAQLIPTIHPVSSTESSPCFMPPLQAIKFKDCIFNDADGARNFAQAISARQQVCRSALNLGLIELSGTKGEGKAAFVEMLEDRETITGVEIVLSPAEEDL